MSQGGSVQLPLFAVVLLLCAVRTGSVPEGAWQVSVPMNEH
jgi:hypothetical protein